MATLGRRRRQASSQREPLRWNRAQRPTLLVPEDDVLARLPLLHLLLLPQSALQMGKHRERVSLVRLQQRHHLLQRELFVR